MGQHKKYDNENLQKKKQYKIYNGAEIIIQ